MTTKLNQAVNEHKLMAKIIDVIKAHEVEQEQELTAIYITGSRLNKTNMESSDYDIIAITKPTLKSVLTGQHYAYQQIMTVDGINVDIKSYDTLYVAQKLLKSDINMVEIFYKTPVFVTFDFESNADYLKSEDMQKYVLAVNSTGLMVSIKNYVRHAEAQLKDETLPLSSQGKLVAKAIKFNRYLNEIISDGRLQSVETPTETEIAIHQNMRNDSSKEQNARLRSQLLERFASEKIKTSQAIELVESGKARLFTAKVDYSRFAPLIQWSYDYGYKPS